MAPTLVPGDEFVAVDTRLARRGNVVAFIHPRREQFWLVKRLSAVAGDTVVTDKGLYGLTGDEGWVISDNKDAPGAIDSRSFGVIDRRKLMPMVTELDGDIFEEGIRLLTKEDEALARLVELHGIPTFWRREPGFETLVLLILEQQVSIESGAAVYKRLREGVGVVSATRIASLEPSQLREMGITRQKAGYVIGLARQIDEGKLDLAALSTLDVEDASQRLQEVKGIGRWTADAYLLSAEGRPDVFPVGDRALQVGTGEALGMENPPTADELETLSEPWRPIRAVAARMIWHAYLTSRGRIEPGS